MNQIHLASYTNVNLKWVEGINVKGTTWKSFRRNIRIFYYLRVWVNFVNQKHKAQDIKVD